MTAVGAGQGAAGVGAGRRAAVVGGGISGLTAALRLSQAGAEVTVVEASDRVGGKLHTEVLAGRPVDAGADAFLLRVPHALDLARELGLEPELVHPASRSAFVLVSGTLHRFPPGLVLGVPTDLEALAATGIVSEAGIARAARDLDEPGSPPEGDTTVGALVRGRLGDEVYETLVAPLLGGVNAGDADELSLEAGAAQLAVAARAGSLIRGAREQLRRGDPEAPVFASLPGGTGALVDALVDRLASDGVRIRTQTRVTRLETTDGGAGPELRLTTEEGSGPLEVDGTVLAVPTFAAAPLLAPHLPDVARELAALEYASAVLVTLVWPRDAVQHPLDGSGFLVAEGEGLLMTACSFGSSKWPHWEHEDTVVFRVSAGRHHDRRALELDDDEVVAALVAELRPVLGLRGEPTATRVTRWLDALPQYRPGHLDRVDRWFGAVADALPGVALAGAGYQGIGIPACVASGATAARAVLAAWS